MGYELWVSSLLTTLGQVSQIMSYGTLFTLSNMAADAEEIAFSPWGKRKKLTNKQLAYASLEVYERLKNVGKFGFSDVTARTLNGLEIRTTFLPKLWYIDENLRKEV